MPHSSPWLDRVRNVHQHSSRPAVVDATGSVTGRTFLGRAVAAADLLTALGTPAGQPVPALLTTNADTLALLVGGAAADRPLAPVGARLTAAELTTVVRNTGARVVLTEPQFAETAQRVASEVGARSVVVPSLPVSAAPLPSSGGPVSFYLHTSGTTGVPKPVPFSDAVLAARTEVLSELIALGPGDRYASGSPVHHIGGIGHVLVALTVGATVLPTRIFSTGWWHSLRRLQVTHCLLVPAMIEMLLADGILDAVPLKTLIYGASPITPSTLCRVMEVLPQVAMVNLFGQTEGSPITSLGPEDHRRAAAGAEELLNTVGRAAPGLRLAIDAPDAQGIGEVIASAPHLSVRNRGGWLHTGDLGVIDEDGYLHLHGRRHDMVIRGGENVYPVEVEQVLSAHPKVTAAGVVGVPDRRLGETLAAFVVPADPADPPSSEELRRFARARVAGFKVPAYWYEAQQLPLNLAGKVVRATLRRWHEQGAPTVQG